MSQPSKKPAMALIKKADRILTRLSKNESQKPPDKIKRKAVRRVRPGEGRIKSELIKYAAPCQTNKRKIIELI